MSLPSRQRSGFTLIEMLLAAGAAAVILAVLVNVYGRAIRVRNTSAEHTRASRIEARAITIIRKDLRNARLSGGLLAQTLTTESLTNTSRFPGNLRFDSTSGTVNEDQFAPELQEVEYYIAEDPNSTDGKSGILKRTLNRNILGSVPEIEREETLLTGVEAMEVGFFDGSDWQPTWLMDPTAPQIPLAMRVRLTMTEGRAGSSRRTIEVLVPWTTQLAIPTTATTFGPADPSDPSDPPVDGQPGGTTP